MCESKINASDDSACDNVGETGILRLGLQQTLDKIQRNNCIECTKSELWIHINYGH